MICGVEEVLFLPASYLAAYSEPGELRFNEACGHKKATTDIWLELMDII